MITSKKPTSPQLSVAFDTQVRANTWGDVNDWFLGKLKVLEGTSVIIKVHADLLMMLDPHNVTEEVHDRGHKLFWDVKAAGADSELMQLASMTESFGVDYVTCMATRASAMRAFKGELMEVVALCVTVPTDWDEADCAAWYGRNIRDQTLFAAEQALEAGFDGVVCASTDAAAVRDTLGSDFMIVTPNIRPQGFTVKGETQNIERKMTPAEAVRAGSNMPVMGRPVWQSESPRETVLSALAEIRAAASLEKAVA